MFCTAWCKEQSFTKASVYIPLSLPLTFLYFILPSSSSFPLPFFIPCLLIYSLILHPLPFPLLSFFLFLPSSPPSLPLLHFSHPFFLSSLLLSSRFPALCSLSSFSCSLLSYLPVCLSPFTSFSSSPSSSLLFSSSLSACLPLFLPPFKPSSRPSPPVLSSPAPSSPLLLPPLLSFLPSSLPPPPPPFFQTFTVALSFWPFSLPLPPHLSSSLFCFPSLLCSPSFLPASSSLLSNLHPGPLLLTFLPPSPSSSLLFPLSLPAILTSLPSLILSSPFLTGTYFTMKGEFEAIMMFFSDMMCSCCLVSTICFFFNIFRAYVLAFSSLLFLSLYWT